MNSYSYLSVFACARRRRGRAPPTFVLLSCCSAFRSQREQQQASLRCAPSSFPDRDLVRAHGLATYLQYNMRGHRSSPRSLHTGQPAALLEVAPAKAPLSLSRKAFRPQQWPSHPPELESARTGLLTQKSALPARLDQPLVRSPRQRGRQLPGPAPTTWQAIEAAAAEAIKPQKIDTTEQLLSELQLSVTADGYKVTCAAPNMQVADLHLSIDTASRVLRLSNAPEPSEREVFTYMARRSCTIYAFPSFNAPKTGVVEEGKRLRGHLPTHFWVGLVQGNGWVRHDEACLSILGRPPLTVEEAMAPLGLPRFILMPEDADLETCGELTPVHGGFFTIECKRKPLPPGTDPADEPTTAGAPPPSRGSPTAMSLMPSPNATRPRSPTLGRGSRLEY